MRCALTLSYNGTSYLGSQTQTETSNTVLGNLEKVLKKLGIDFRVVASGRTDKGVHATGQVCHIDLPEFWDDLEKLKRVINKMLPSSIHIKSIQEVSADFHARYSAKTRVYRYIIKKGVSNPFEEGFITFDRDADFKLLKKNIAVFIGEHDFKNFMKTGSDSKSSVRVIYRAFAYMYNGYIILNFEANGFLRSQIRLMVGALLQLNITQIQEQLTSSKKYKVRPAKSNGLYLSKIKY